MTTRRHAADCGRAANPSTKASRACLAILAISATWSAASVASADPVADFYRGKQLQIRPLRAGRQLRPVFPAGREPHDETYPGPSHLRAPSHDGRRRRPGHQLHGERRAQGTVMTIVSNGLPGDQALGLAGGIEADMAALNWIGNISSSNEVMVAWHTAGENFADAKKIPLIIGACGVVDRHQIGAVTGRTSWDEFKIVYGYPGGAPLNLDGAQRDPGAGGGLWATVKATTPQWIVEKKINVLMQVGLKREPDLPDCPAADRARRETPSNGPSSTSSPRARWSAVRLRPAPAYQRSGLQPCGRRRPHHRRSRFPRRGGKNESRDRPRRRRGAAAAGHRHHQRTRRHSRQGQAGHGAAPVGRSGQRAIA